MFRPRFHHMFLDMKDFTSERSEAKVRTFRQGLERNVPAPPRRVALWSGPFEWMVPTVGCLGTLDHIL